MKGAIATQYFKERADEPTYQAVKVRMTKKKLLEPKRAAIEAEVYAQQIYQAIANKLLVVERRSGRVYITRRSFERWKRNLEARRRMRIEEEQAQEAHV